MPKPKPMKTPKAAVEDELLDCAFLSKLVVGIGEVAEITGVPQRQLRYWQQKGVVKGDAGTSASTTRRFDYLDIKKILLIKDLLDEGYTLEAAAVKVVKRITLLNSAFKKLKEKNKK